MSNLFIGILCMLLSLVIFFYSPQEGSNMLGYKSPQQGKNKKIWYWSNKCFGILAIIGSAIYLILSLILKFMEITLYDHTINSLGLAYIFICIIITEVYTFICSHKKAKR